MADPQLEPLNRPAMLSRHKEHTPWPCPRPGPSSMSTLHGVEEDQPERHEYLAGEVFAMSGGTDAHYTILLNTATSLKAALSGKPCRTFVSGMKLRIDRADAVFYPDVFVTCDARDRQPEASLAKQYPA